MAWPALSAQQLPTVARADARIVMTSDEGGTIERDDVEQLASRASYVPQTFGDRPSLPSRPARAVQIQ
jgi:hypothetical protein